MNNIVVRFNKPVLIKESKEEELDEVWGNVGLAYKWLGPLHQILNMTDPAEEDVLRGFLEWYQKSRVTQFLGGAVSKFEKMMNKAWESGRAGKSAALTVQGILTGGDIITGGAGSTAVGYFARQVRDEMEKEMEKEKLEMVEKAAAAIAAAKKEAAAASQGAMAIAENPKLKAIIDQLQADIRQKDFERAKQLFDAAKKLKEETRKTDDEKGERMTQAREPSPLTRSSQETMYVNETKDKKMTKKYSSFKDQHRITENFRRFMNEEDELGYLDPDDRKRVEEKMDLLHLSANVDFKLDLDLGDYWEFIEPIYLGAYTEAYDNAAGAFDHAEFNESKNHQQKA